MEPGLTQAVRIVLKYEIQSLLSRLAETGEEYIVFTASTDEGTCGHMGSVKGEGFVKSSSLQNVKQQFLNFCTGKEKSPTPFTNVTSTPKQNRRKSTPRYKFQHSAVPSDDLRLEVPKICPPMKENIASSGNLNDSACALDLSDKSGGYAYTLESKDDQPRYNGNASQVSFGFQYEDVANKLDFPDVKLPRFMWQDEKLHPVSQDQPESGSENNTAENPKEKCVDEMNEKNKNLALDCMTFGDLSLFGGVSNAAKGRQQQGFQNKRKARKGLVTRQRKALKQEVIEPSINSLLPNGNENILKSDSDNHITSSLAGEIDTAETVHNHATKTESSTSLSDITDMKSAFEEIGNMAKCLICNKILANKNNRTFHWRSHVGDKRYTCDICQKAFTHPSNMRSHRKIHTDEKPFPCDLCERRFRRRDYLLQHLERFHYNPKQVSDKSLNESESFMDLSENQSFCKLDSSENQSFCKLDSSENLPVCNLDPPENQSDSKLDPPQNQSASKLDPPQNQSASKLDPPQNQSASKLDPPQNQYTSKLEPPDNQSL